MIYGREWYTIWYRPLYRMYTVPAATRVVRVRIKGSNETMQSKMLFTFRASNTTLTSRQTKNLFISLFLILFLGEKCYQNPKSIIMLA